jgi:hypothetical protein
VLSGRADHSPRGDLPTAVCRCVWSSNLVNEEALVHWGCRTKNRRFINDRRFVAHFLDKYSFLQHCTHVRKALLFCTARRAMLKKIDIKTFNCSKEYCAGLTKMRKTQR